MQIKGDECYIFVSKGNEEVFDMTQQAWIIIKPLKNKLRKKPPQSDRLFSKRQ